MSANSPSYSLLVIDDEPDLRTLYELTLLREGYELDSAGSVEDAIARLQQRPYSAVITDMRLPDGSGLDVLNWLEAQGRREKALVITAFGSAENAVEALKAGAYDYLTKPVDLRQFRMVVAAALGRLPHAMPSVVPSQLPSERPAASAEAAQEASSEGVRAPAAPSKPVRPPPAPNAVPRLAGDSEAMRQVRSLIEKVARSMAPVLLQGESGTGKELVARSIHEVSVRAPQPFIAVNCGAIPEQLLEAEFFGYRKGAFTGAAEDREGFFQAAHGGTLFLDEIGDLPLAMQSKLLRSIQERSVRPVGAVVEAPVNVRILSATHKDLAAEVAAGRFRQDLFYRLNVIQIRVPPLRERLEDLPAISARVLERIARDAGIEPAPRLGDSGLALLRRYAFPGNVRELENLLHRALALSGGDSIEAVDLGLPEALLDQPESPVSEAMPLEEPVASEMPVAAIPGANEVPLPTDLAVHLDEVERRILVRALEAHRNNRTAAGASLGLSLRQMRYRMARLGVNVGEAAEAGEGADG
ncbi:sigma-54 dependent transcriptional regulator [Paucibacter sp. APW11]|uniref:Sigma-54 dependent transcriptional regulator n=1 Tax=Roseateles aquae TaxID=3077235 RepID=A0ABU3PFQ1_9BURK|nr:sigma-54 dependent transcriptional regulator [Paucibacter sp. APW11]MDT9001152.1 sigma-54 dependent transcriptional regulator [Paucibacter sp. APW11]